MSPSATGTTRIGLLGAGNFVKATLLPAIKESGIGPIEVICSAGGASARMLADKHKIPKVSTSATEVINDPNVDLVMIATPHDTHADLVVEALEAGKHVFCEKPLAMTMEELDRIEAAWEASGKVLQVGFNRRYAPAAVHAKKVLGTSGGPLVITYRVNAGELPDSHWYKDRRFGGRLIGEACHYIDLCGFFCDDQEPEVHVFGSGVGEPALDEDFIITLRYPRRQPGRPSATPPAGTLAWRRNESTSSDAVTRSRSMTSTQQRWTAGSLGGRRAVDTLDQLAATSANLAAGIPDVVLDVDENLIACRLARGSS